MDFTTNPASEYPMTELADLLNRSFENYFVPIAFHVTSFLNMVRKDAIDLTVSQVLLADGEPMGMALLARRGWTSRLAAMGIVKDWRDMGAGSWFMKQLIAEACERGEREMVLEVIEQNEPAIHLYESCGFQILRRLIGLIRRDAIEEDRREIQEMDILEVSHFISHYGVPDLPWQLSGETIAQMNPPTHAYGMGPAYMVISNPEAKDIIIWSLVVEGPARGSGLGVDMLKSMIAQNPGKTWHVPALLPEGLGKVYERVGFVREELSQWQMKLILQPKC